MKKYLLKIWVEEYKIITIDDTKNLRRSLREVKKKSPNLNFTLLEVK